MANWIRVASVQDVAIGTAREAIAGERIVAIYNVDGQIHAMEALCPHQGGPLGQGKLNGCVVTCPWHGWQFDVTTGQHQANPRLRQPCLPVKVEGDDIYVDVSE